MKRAAESEWVSQSKWVAKLIEERLATSWSEEVEQLVGAWPDFLEAERQQGEDLPRDSL